MMWHQGPTPPDSHGEFGLVARWRDDPDLRDTIATWLRTSPEVRDIAETLVTQNPALTALELETFARDQLFDRIDAAARNTELSGEIGRGAGRGREESSVG